MDKLGFWHIYLCTWTTRRDFQISWSEASGSIWSKSVTVRMFAPSASLLLHPFSQTFSSKEIVDLLFHCFVIFSRFGILCCKDCHWGTLVWRWSCILIWLECKQILEQSLYYSVISKVGMSEGFKNFQIDLLSFSAQSNTTKCPSHSLFSCEKITTSSQKLWVQLAVGGIFLDFAVCSFHWATMRKYVCNSLNGSSDL